MSFRCKICNQAQKNGTSPVITVVEQRRVVYPERKKGNRVIDCGGVGTETVRELMVCADCATSMSS